MDVFRPLRKLFTCRPRTGPFAGVWIILVALWNALRAGRSEQTLAALLQDAEAGMMAAFRDMLASDPRFAHLLGEDFQLAFDGTDYELLPTGRQPPGAFRLTDHPSWIFRLAACTLQGLVRAPCPVHGAGRSCQVWREVRQPRLFLVSPPPLRRAHPGRVPNQPLHMFPSALRAQAPRRAHPALPTIARRARVRSRLRASARAPPP